MERTKKQFKGTSIPKAFYDRKVRIVGYSRVLSVSKILPEDWLYVRMRVLNKLDGAVEVLFTKLMGREDDTHTEEASEESG